MGNSSFGVSLWLKPPRTPESPWGQNKEDPKCSYIIFSEAFQVSLIFHDLCTVFCKIQCNLCWTSGEHSRFSNFSTRIQLPRQGSSRPSWTISGVPASFSISFFGFCFRWRTLLEGAAGTIGGLPTRGARFCKKKKEKEKKKKFRNVKPRCFRNFLHVECQWSWYERCNNSIDDNIGRPETGRVSMFFFSVCMRLSG